VSAVQPKRLDPRTVLIKFIKSAPEQVIGAPAVYAFVSGISLWKGLLFIGAFAGLNLLVRFLSWWRFTYTILPNEMYIESGVLSRNKRSIPWDRIQDVDIERELLARIFGLAKVKLETGGAGQDEGSLDSISLDDAQALRAMIRARKGAETAARLALDPADAAPALQMPVIRIVQAGLFHFSILWMVAIYFGLQQFGPLLPIGLKDVEKWLGLNEAKLLGMVNISTILFALAVFLVVGTVSGVIQTLVANYGFRITEEEGGLRRERGLFTRSEILIPKHRIQMASFTSHWIQRRLGLGHVAVQTLGGDAKQAGGVQDLVPLGTEAEIAQLLALAGEFKLADPHSLRRVSPLHPLLDGAGNALILGLASLIMGYFWHPALWGLVLALAAGMLSWFVVLAHRWSLEGDTLYVRRGWFTQKTAILPIRNVQALSVSRGLIQRKFGLASLYLDTAGGSMFGVRIQNLADTDAERLASKLRAAKPRGRS
jgi:putative membrane protein